jgi:hypothetical protein
MKKMRETINHIIKESVVQIGFSLGSKGAEPTTRAAIDGT